MIYNLMDIEIPNYHRYDITKLKKSSKKSVFLIDFQMLNQSLVTKLINLNEKNRIIVYDKSPHWISRKSAYQLGVDYYVGEIEEIELICNMLLERYYHQPLVNLNSLESELIYKERHIRFSKKEFVILSYLFDHKDEVCLRKDILVNILGYHQEADTRIVDVYIKHLRQKLEGLPLKIETVRKKGYTIIDKY